MNQQTRQRTEDQYVMPVEASRRGAHRARVSPLLGALPFVAVAVVVVGVVLLAWTLFGGNGGTSTVAEPASGVSSAASPPASGKPAASSAAAEPSASKSTAAEPSKTPSKSPAAQVDKTLKIVVRNSTGTKGLAAGAADRLKAKGWTINGIPDNYKPTIDSTVFYNDPSQKPSAQAVARILGIDLVKPDPTMAAKGVTVVLGPDYQS